MKITPPSINNFRINHEWQIAMRDHYLVPGYYEKSKQPYILIDGIDEISENLQKRYHVDTIVRGMNGHPVYIDEKIIQYKGIIYDSFFFETMSCTIPGRETEGWMRTGRSNLLVNTFQRKSLEYVDVYVMDFPLVQQWFWPRVEKFIEINGDKENKSKGRLVKIDDLRCVFPDIEHYQAYRDPDRELDKKILDMRARYGV